MGSGNIRADDFPWFSIPNVQLFVELIKRDISAAPTEPQRPQPHCGSSKRGSYDTALHVFALFLIFSLSTLACGFPLISRRSSRSRNKQHGASRLVFLCQHFGTGVLLATAFVHLLPTAFASLTDPCLPYFFSKRYKPLAGLIAMVSALVVASVESCISTRGAGHSHSHHHIWDENEAEVREASNGPELLPLPEGFAARHTCRPADISLDDVEASWGLVDGLSPLPGSTPTVAVHDRRPEDSGANGNNTDLSLDHSDASYDSPNLDIHSDELMDGPRSGDKTLSPLEPRILVQQNTDVQKRLLLQCLLLEAGILFHSVFIGMALSVAKGPAFVIFLVAIAFHQSFEGLALGSRIAALHFPRSSPRPWLMVFAFGATTPVGQAVGLVVHNMYDPMSRTSLLMVGFMNAISSGLLLFAGLVQLLAEDFLSEKSYTVLNGRRRRDAFLAMLAGAALMTAVGALA